MISAIKETRRDRLFLACNYVFLLLALVVVAYPILYIISASISTPKYVASGEMWLWPMGLTFEGYQRVFRDPQIWTGYGNTILYTVLGTMVNLAVTIPAAYALSRKDFVGRNLFMGIFMVTMFFSGGLVPTYLLIKDLGLVNSMWALILPGLPPSGISSFAGRISNRRFRRSCRRQRKSMAAAISGCFSASSCRCRLRLSRSWPCSLESGTGTATSPR